jgi:hypothetical protein
MKKILFLMFACFLSSCACVLSQIPPQKIYATPTSCSAPLPDYWVLFGTKVIVSDNCEIASKTQVPASGFMLTPTNKTTTVTLRVTDGSGNYRQTVFTVNLLDTIKPVFTIDPTLLTYQIEQINTIYDYGDILVKGLTENMDNTFPFDSFPGSREKWTFNEYNKKTLVIASKNELTGVRSRFISFADSLTIFTKTK